MSDTLLAALEKPAAFAGASPLKTWLISSTNLWVLLHRARLRLRECLQQHWFAARPATA